MAFSGIVVLSLCAVAFIHGAAITDLPGFEHFIGCKTNACWIEDKDYALHKLFKTGHAPLGIPKIDPFHVGIEVIPYPQAKSVLHNVELSGFDTADIVRSEVDAKQKVINQEATYDLTFKGNIQQTLILEKEYKFQSNFEAHYPKVVTSLKQKFDFEKKEYEGKDETFLVLKDYDLSYKFDGKPLVKYDQAFLDEVKNIKAVQKWLKEHDAEIQKARRDYLDKHVKTFYEAMLSVYKKIHENFPISQIMPQFNQ